LPPQYRSALAEDPAGRLEFLRGAALLGLRFDPTADPSTPGVLKPQQLLISDLLDQPNDDYVFLLPRRSAKTVSILAKVLGRCLCRPGYMVAYMAQSGVAGSRRLRDWKTTLDRINPPDDLELPPWKRNRARQPSKRKTPAERRHLELVALFGEELLPIPTSPFTEGLNDDRQEEGDGSGSRRGFRILMGEVGKGIYFENGSQLLVYKPDADAVRGDAADIIWIDEAQDIDDPEEAAVLMAGLEPLTDTREGSAVVVSGTAGPARLGPLWERIVRLIEGDEGLGGAVYTAGQYEVDAEPIDWELLQDEDSAIDLVRRSHPGLGTLTTEAKMRQRYRSNKSGLPQWAREYLGIWPRTAGARAVPLEWWENGVDDELSAAIAGDAPHPTRVAFGLDVKPGGESAAIVAAWRDDEGHAFIELVEHRLGTSWIPKRLQALSRTYAGCDTAYDNIAEGAATALEATRLKPAPRMRVQTYLEHAAGCVQIMRDLERGELHHGDQGGLNAAVRIAARRQVRGEDRGKWLWAVGPEGGDITPLVAATRALRAWDQHYAGKRSRRRVVSAR
jgi:hypothetical protein